MKLNGYIELKRGDRSSVVRMMTACEKALRAGNSIMMFPEGTRSPTGRMRTFKTGAFEVALRVGCAVQPLVIQGTSNALPKRGFVLQGRHPIRITVLDPIPPETFGDLSAEDLMELVRERIAETLDAKEETATGVVGA